MSPFGLFMTKMKMYDNQVKSMSFDRQIHHCNEFYKKLTPEDKKQYQDLSSLAKSSGLNDQEVYRRLKRIAINLDNGNGDNKNDDEELWDNEPMATSKASSSGQMTLGFNFSKTGIKLVKTEEYNDEDEDDEDIFGYIEKVIAETKELEKKTIVVICFNVLVHTMEGQYCPNEVGISKFSVADGFMGSYTDMIGWEIPDGYYAKAMDFSNAFHKIPIVCKDNVLFESDVTKVFHEIHDHLSSSGLSDSQNRKIVFCKAEDKSGLSDRPQVKGCLKALEKAFVAKAGKSAKSLLNDFVVAELTDMLFLTGKRCCGPNVMPRVMGMDTLAQAKFDYYPDMRCEFHAETDNNYCALAVVKKSAYLFLDHLFATGLTSEYDIKPTDAHRPKPPEDNTYSIVPKLSTNYKEYRKDYRYYRANNSASNPTPVVDEPIRSPSVRVFEGQNPRIGIGRARSIQNMNQKRY